MPQLTFSSIYSGVGGSDCGFCRAGLVPLWQCEADLYRRRVLQSRFGVPVIHRAEDLLNMAVPTPDLLCADLPDARTELWWPAVFACAERFQPRWLLAEWSPTVRCERSGWTCVCDQASCACDPDARVRAVQDSCSPFATQWWAEMLMEVPGVVSVTGGNRGLTQADGQVVT